MDMEKAKAWLINHREYLKETYQYLEEDAFSSGPMCYEQRQRRDSACERRKSIERELLELNNIIEDNNE